VGIGEQPQKKAIQTVVLKKILKIDQLILNQKVVLRNSHIADPGLPVLGNLHWHRD
jgi:hypothetical protein